MLKSASMDLACHNRLRRQLLVPIPGRTDAVGPDNDFLAQEKAELKRLSDALGTSQPLTSDDAKRLLDLYERWSAGKSSVTLLAAQIKTAGENLLSGDLSRLIDLEGARRRVGLEPSGGVKKNVIQLYKFFC